MIDFSEIRIIIRKIKQSRQLRIRVREDGSVLCTLPHRVSLVFAKQFLFRKRAWIEDAYTRALRQPLRLLHQGGKDEYVATKEAARQCIISRVEYFQTIYKVNYRRISIRNQRTRFGSCSAQGNLSFNYRLIFLPASLRDYVVVHELCHLKELNHSRKFWALVAETMPDYRERRRELQAFSRPRS